MTVESPIKPKEDELTTEEDLIKQQHLIKEQHLTVQSLQQDLALGPLIKPKEQDLITVHVRLNRALIHAFRALCALRGYSLRDAIYNLIIQAFQDPVLLPTNQGQETEPVWELGDFDLLITTKPQFHYEPKSIERSLKSLLLEEV